MKRSKKEKPLIQEKLRVDLREKYRDTLFHKWHLRDLSAMHRFVDSDDDSIIMSFSLPKPLGLQKAADLVIESWDGGKTWAEYSGGRSWPDSTRGIFRRGRAMIALHGGSEFRRSYDYGYTWGPPMKISTGDDIHFDGLGVPNCFSAIMITAGTWAGRIVLVADYFLGQEGPGAQLMCSIYSDDWGDSWRASRLFWPSDPLPKGPEGFGEPAVVQMSGGWLWMVFRTLYGELWQCISQNGGESWNHPTPTGLSSPIANCYAKRSPYTGATVLCWNMTKPGTDVSFKSRHGLYRPRTNLAFAISRDNCRSWSCPVVIDPQGSQYPTIHFTKEKMFIMYQSAINNEITAWHEQGLTLVSYDREEVEALPTWTRETIQPYIEKGLVAHWLALNCPQGYPDWATIS